MVLFKKVLVSKNALSFSSIQLDTSSIQQTQTNKIFALHAQWSTLLEVLDAEGVHNSSYMTLIQACASLILFVIRVVNSLELSAYLYVKKMISTIAQSPQIPNKYVKSARKLILIPIQGRALHPVNQEKFNNKRVRDAYVQRSIVRNFSLTMSRHASKNVLT